MRAPISSAWSARIFNSPSTPNASRMLSGALLADGFQCMLLNAANAERDMGALIERVLEYRVCAIVVMNGTPPSRIVKECLEQRRAGDPRQQADAGLRCRHRGHRSRGRRPGGRRASSRRRMQASRRRVERCADRELSRTPRRVPQPGGAGRRVRCVIWRDGPTDYSTGREAALAMLADDAIDGAFCVTDLIALGFLDAARLDRGRRVPDDLSVIGFDDIPQAGWSAYRLTTFRQPVRLLTDAVMQVIRQRAENPESPHGDRSRCLRLRSCADRARS